MSNAKICDQCSNLFPEGTEGSESGIGTINKIENGRNVTLQQVRDWCPECVNLRNGGTRVFRLALEDSRPTSHDKR